MTNMDLAALMDSEVMRNYLQSSLAKEAAGHSDMDSAALMDSKVVCDYLQSELVKEASVKTEPSVDEEQVVEAFVDFEEQVQKNEKMLSLKEQYTDVAILTRYQTFLVMILP